MLRKQLWQHKFKWVPVYHQHWNPNPPFQKDRQQVLLLYQQLPAKEREMKRNLLQFLQLLYYFIFNVEQILTHFNTLSKMYGAGDTQIK